MPKLDPFQIASRLDEKLEDLRTGKEVAARDLKVLLSDERLTAIDQAWEKQKTLRKQKRARTKEDEAALGWKSKREVLIEAVEAELAMHHDNALDYLEKEMNEAELRGARIFMDAVCKAKSEGKTLEQAMNIANNDLTRAGLQRTDRRKFAFRNKRDREVLEMEQSIMQKLESEMDDYEREQLELSREFDRAMKAKWQR